MLPPFAEHLDVAKIHVQAPAAVIFLCGGKTTSLGNPVPVSIRDAFLKILDNPATKGRHVLQAEEITVFYLSRAAYADLLLFETDIAQITELIVLFCESAGSLVELGAFSMVPEIAERLLVILRDKHYSEESFVRLGPLLSLQNAYGESTIYVVDDQDIGVVGENYSGIDKNVLRDRLNGPISHRINETKQATTFDPDKSGHLIKFIVGLVQEYGALTAIEIQEILESIGVGLNMPSVNQYLLCGEAVEWIKAEKKGLQTYYFPLLGKDAATLILKPEAATRDRGARRLLIPFTPKWRNDMVRA